MPFAVSAGGHYAAWLHGASDARCSLDAPGRMAAMPSLAAIRHESGSWYFVGQRRLCCLHQLMRNLDLETILVVAVITLPACGRCTGKLIHHWHQLLVEFDLDDIRAAADIGSAIVGRP